MVTMTSKDKITPPFQDVVVVSQFLVSLVPLGPSPNHFKSTQCSPEEPRRDLLLPRVLLALHLLFALLCLKICSSGVPKYPRPR
ncbi:hypothetical protein RHMOL_Rhmol09G0035600 [Rhododendron molle]|uniref:Uncharacterized protein n=1 Tax=Rhododendron molle TaxID=49168 RepID=A0ACC0M9Z7_RHOML|nr:hypothetical protein RHMOL_Rhmol09G0035600 [Rhododendron molle]